MTLVARTLCIESGYKEQAAAICACLPSGAGMFERPYGTIDSETGEQTIAGYISHGPIDYVYAGWLETQDTAAIVSAAAQAGLTVTEAEVQTVLDHSVCTTQEPREWFSENGYVLL